MSNVSVRAGGSVWELEEKESISTATDFRIQQETVYRAWWPTKSVTHSWRLTVFIPVRYLNVKILKEREHKCISDHFFSLKSAE